jgi:hypothetical protein
MKAAISLPDQVFYEAEETAHYMGHTWKKIIAKKLLKN